MIQSKRVRSALRACLVSGLLLSTAFAGSGCATSSGPYQPANAGRRDTDRAAELTRRAAEHIDSDPGKAEALLREALTADLYHGPAHNNLGAVFLNRGQLYEAASEFERARKLMPGHPDPRINLAMTLEEAGRIDEAIDAYRTALEVFPGHLPAIMGLTRTQVRHNRSDDGTEEQLRTIVMRADADWRRWAERELIRRDASDLP